jgi:hypothetical protein
MDFIDTLIIVSCVAGLIYFAFDRIKYSNITVFYKKQERLFELNKIITVIKIDIKETDEIIKTVNIDTLYDDIFTDKLIAYRDNMDKLILLKKEQKEIEIYLKNFRMYKHSGIKYYE